MTARIKMPPTRFIVPVHNDLPQIPAWIKPLDVEIRSGYAEILVEDRAVVYLSERRYASKVEMPKIYVSHSQIDMFCRCPLSYKFRYIDGIKAPPSAAAAIGQSVHRTAEHNNKQKLFTREDISAEDAKNIFSDAWEELAPSVAFEEGENPGAVKDQGISLVDLLMAEVAPTIQPKAVELEFNQAFTNTDYELKGYIDVVTEENIIIDLKTKGKSPSDFEVAQNSQITAYYLGHKNIYGEYPKGARMDFLVKTKTPKYVPKDTWRTPEQISQWLDLVENIARAIRAGIFFPNPQSTLCSPKWCGYWNICPQGDLKAPY